MVVLLTADALESDAVRNSISYALGEKAFTNRLVPVLVDDSPDFPHDRIPWIFKRLKTITLNKDSQESEQFKKIAQAIKDAA
jgi:hypothetical protein